MLGEGSWSNKLSYNFYSGWKSLISVYFALFSVCLEVDWRRHMGKGGCVKSRNTVIWRGWKLLKKPSYNIWILPYIIFIKNCMLQNVKLSKVGYSAPASFFLQGLHLQDSTSRTPQNQRRSSLGCPRGPQLQKESHQGQPEDPTFVSAESSKILKDFGFVEFKNSTKPHPRETTLPQSQSQSRALWLWLWLFWLCGILEMESSKTPKSQSWSPRDVLEVASFVLSCQRCRYVRDLWWHIVLLFYPEA